MADMTAQDTIASKDDLAILTDLVQKVRRLGADAADAVLFDSASVGVSYRLGAVEDVERSESRDLGLRVFVGKRQAIVSSTDLSLRALDELAERGLAMARSAPEDPYCGLADEALLERAPPELDLEDDREPSTEALIERAAKAEDAARAVEGITNSEGGGAGFRRGAVTLVTSNGFAGRYGATAHSVHASVLAGEGTHMERDYAFRTARHLADLATPEEVGREAGERTVRRLDPRKADSAQVPIVYDPRVAAGLLGHFAGAISGVAIARRTSFLKDRMGEEVFAPGIVIVDDPHRVRGLGSKPFDGEGVRNSRREVVSDGRLTTWLLSTSSARQLGLETTGHASRGTSSPPGPAPTNLHMEPGQVSPEDLIAGIVSGFYVTELIGMGVNGVTGDYSRGASGFWIENGQISYPVSEITIAGNLRDMFRHLTPANDLEFRRAANAPTLRVEGMTVAGR